MAIEIFVLSALRSGPLHGYALRKRVQRPSLRPVSNNSLYPMLRRFEESGAITHVVEASPDGRPDRKVYSLTDEGERVLHGIVRELPAALAADEEEFLVRVSFFHELPVEDRLGILAVRRAVLETAARQVRALLDASSHAPERVWRDRAQQQLLARLEQELGWLDDVARAAAEVEVDAP